jgi:hypothetical protein
MGRFDPKLSGSRGSALVAVTLEQLVEHTDERDVRAVVEGDDITQAADRLGRQIGPIIAVTGEANVVEIREAEDGFASA